MSSTPHPHRPAALPPVPATCLLTLQARAEETLTPHPLIIDDVAVDLARRLALGPFSSNPTRLDGRTRSGTIVRTHTIDTIVRDFLRDHPRGHLINLGAGLDTRAWRMGGPHATFTHLDLEEIISHRRRLLPAAANCADIAADLRDPGWATRLQPHRADPADTLILLEGVTMYLRPDTVELLLDTIIESFPGALLVVDLLSARVLRLPYLSGSIRRAGARFTYGVSDPGQLCSTHPQLRLLDSVNLADRMRLAHPWGGMASRLPGLRRLSNTIATYRIDSHTHPHTPPQAHG